MYSLQLIMAKRRWATGKRSYAMCDRGGHKIPYQDVRTEWNGLRVDKNEWEEKHPQLTPARNVGDAQAVRNPRPDNDDDGTVSAQLRDLIDMTHGDT